MEARIIKRRCVSAALAAAIIAGGATAATAGANPILSGYGGPGQGSQAILGSALVNGSGSGGGRSGGSQAGGSGGSVTSIAAALAAPVDAGATSRLPSRSATGGRSTGARPAGRARRPAPEPARRNAAGAYSASHSRPTAQPLLGISRSAFTGIVVAVGALILVGLLTRRSARTDAAARPSKATASTHRTTG
jgi:hypothetical protein